MQLCAIPSNSTNDQPLVGAASTVFCQNVDTITPDEGVDSQVEII